MTFYKPLKTIKNNKQTLLDFMGYDTIAELRAEGFSTNTQAFSYARQQYNAEVKLLNIQERNSRIINPLTNRSIKKYTIFNLDGTIRKKYSVRLVIENGVLIKNPSFIGIDVQTNEIAKFNINNADVPFLQQTFGFNIPKDKISQDSQVNNIIFKHQLEPDEEVILTVRVVFEVNFSEEWETKTVIKTALFSGRELSDPNIAMSIILEDPVWTASTLQFRNISMSIITTMNKASITLDNMVLREAEPLDISTLYNEVINQKKIEHCIHDYMFKLYPKHSKSENQKNKIRQLHTTNDIYEWCKNYNIKMIAIDINRNVIKSHYPKKNNKLKNMIYLAFNSHLYPLKNQYLKKNKITKYSVVVTENSRDKLINYLESGILPTDIKLDSDGNISSFIIVDDNDENICYTENTEYDKCLEILDKFGIKDKMTVGTKISHLGRYLEELYRHDMNSNSFFPYGNDFNKGGYNYHNADLELEEDETFQTIDKNKSYSYELSQLPYLIKCDTKYHRSKKICEILKPHTIISHYLYIVEIDCPSLHLPNNDYFEGHTLIKAREEGLKFRILEEQETEMVPNYFKDMVNDLYDKLDNDTFKKIMNIHIGKFEMSSMKYSYLDFDKLLGNEELATFDGQVFSLNENYYVGCKMAENINIFNKKPISVQVKDRSRLRLFNMMKTLGLKNSDIKQVKTDSITFKSHTDKYIDYIHNNLSGWKIEEFSSIQKPNILRRDPRTFDYKSYGGNEYDKIKKNGIIGLGNAGCGKTYTITNDIIPTMNDDYIVLSPSYATITDYKKLNLNCHVIQTFIFSNSIPEAHNIIVDEIGMVDVAGWNMLVKCKIAGKNIMVFGDNTQLEPVKSRLCDNPNFYNLMFDTHLPYNTKNYRNNFSVEYYDSLRQTNKNICNNNEFFGKKRLNEVIKHNTEYDKADVILAYTRNTRDKYNALMCEKLGINSICDIGTKIICKTNELGKQNIFNNFCYEVMDCVDDMVHISNGEIGNITEIKIKDMKNFDYAYARTTHSVQGRTLNSFHYCIEDVKWLGGRELYTLISRLKQKQN